MRSSLLLTVSFGTLLAATSSQAAGPFDWSGFYAGMGVGPANLADTHVDHYVPGGPPDATWADQATGPLASVDGGYNWQQGMLVFGVEGRLGLAGVSVTSRDTLADDDIKTSLGGLASLEGRLGIALDKFLLYGGAGIAAGQVSVDPVPPSNGDYGPSSSGFKAAAIGTVGAEYSLSDKVSLKADLSALRFQDINMSGADYALNTKSTAVIGQVGVNFHF